MTYKGWTFYFINHSGTNNRWAVYRFGVTMCANTKQELKTMIDLRSDFW